MNAAQLLGGVGTTTVPGAMLGGLPAGAGAVPVPAAANVAGPAASTQMATLMTLATSAKEHGIALPPAVMALMASAGGQTAGSPLGLTGAAAGQSTMTKLQAALLGGSNTGDIGGSGESSSKDALMELLAKAAAAKEGGDDEGSDEVEADADSKSSTTTKSTSDDDDSSTQEDGDSGSTEGGGAAQRMSTIDRATATLDAGAYPDEAGLPDNSAGASKDHVIARGESLESIAQTYHTTMQALAYVNDLRGFDDIHPGQLIQVPNKA